MKTIFIFILISLIFISCKKRKTLDEKFAEEEFRLEPFQKAKEIKELTDFLLDNAELIVYYNQHKDIRTIQLTEGSYYGHYTKEGDCFTIATFREEFINEYFPPYLVSRFYQLFMKIQPDFIKAINICTKKSEFSLSKELGSISYAFNYKNKDIRDGTYYLTHGLYYNAKFTPNHKQKDEEDKLAKDTLFIENIRYGIWFTPNTGW